MKLQITCIALSGLFLNPLAIAQEQTHTHHAHTANGARNPYVANHARTIKALSEQDISDIRAGKGMSMALAAELNGYPGPMHVLELGDQLKLTDAQRTATSALRMQMQTQAIAAGEDWINAEAALDALFKNKHVTTELLSKAAARAAQAQGQLRATHLRYHLLMMEVLSPEQVSRYQQLRGY